MAVEHNCVDERTNVGNNKNKDNNDGYNSVDEEGWGSFADNNDGNNSKITKMGNNNSSNSAGSTKLSPGKLKLSWYDKLSVVQQRQVEMNFNAVLYSGCMAAAPQLFETTMRQQEANNNDDDNVVGDLDLDNDLVLRGDIAGNKDQDIATSIRGEEDNVGIHDEGKKGIDNEFNNLCNKDDGGEGGVLLTTILPIW